MISTIAPPTIPDLPSLGFERDRLWTRIAARINRWRIKRQARQRLRALGWAEGEIRWAMKQLDRE